VGKKVRHHGHELWVECMRGDDKAWKLMEKYNKKDVTLLEDVYNKLLPWIKDHPNRSLFTDGEVCSNCGSEKLQKRGHAYTQVYKYQRYQCLSCGLWLRSKNMKKDAELRVAL
jgi:hypothetical protein